jgi:hypothetical protein
VSVFLRLERRIEAIVEGFFSRWARDRVHPVEIGRRLLREMDDGAVAGFESTLVPNEYRVFLHPQDFAPYTSFTQPLIRELEDALRSRATELGAQLPGPVQVSLGSRDEITPGAIYVAARLVPGPESGPSAGPAGQPDPSSVGRSSGRTAARHDDDQKSEEGRRGSASAGEGEPGSDTRVYRRAPGTPRLRVQAGPPGAAGREMALDRPLMTIGRRADQDIVLNDPSVSRTHARLQVTPDGVSIVDLDSTNGTLVNGHPVLASPVAIRPGDRIQVGSVLLELLAGS